MAGNPHYFKPTFKISSNKDLFGFQRIFVNSAWIMEMKLKLTENVQDVKVNFKSV